MITALELAKFAEKNGWIVVNKGEGFIRYLTPSGKEVKVTFFEDGSIRRIYP